MTLTIHSIRAVANAPTLLSADDLEALAWARVAFAQVVSTLERYRWSHDDAHVGPHAPLLEQARRDLDAATAAEDAAREARTAAYVASRAWVREAVL
jgi:hypothetical protein